MSQKKSRCENDDAISVTDDFYVVDDKGKVHS